MRGKTMSLVPAFELGFWNAWIFVLSFLMLFIVGGILDRLRGQKGVGHAAMLDKRFNEDVLAFLRGASEGS